MTLVDHHTHLDFPDLMADIDGVVARAAAAGVTTMTTISTRIKKYDTYRALAERFPRVFFSVGTHPHYAHEELDVPVAEIIAKSEHPKCIAIGEAGLDYLVEADKYRGGLIFQTERIGAFFYCLPEKAEEVRKCLAGLGYKAFVAGEGG